MHHFFTRPELLGPETAVIEGDEARHAARVLRVRPGERITVADGRGRVADAVVESVGPAGVRAGIAELREVAEPVPRLVLYQAVAKGDRMDQVVQKAVEVGVCRIVAFEARRSLVRWDDAKRLRARQRWAAVALSAAKQSRAPWTAEIGEVAGSVEAAGPDEDCVVVLHEAATTRLRDALPPMPSSVGIVVGPEGGLEAAEVVALQGSGAIPVTLGERILRTETAGPVALALVSFFYGTLG